MKDPWTGLSHRVGCHSPIPVSSIAIRQGSAGVFRKTPALSCRTSLDGTVTSPYRPNGRAGPLHPPTQQPWLIVPGPGPRGRKHKSQNTPAIQRPPPRSMEPPPGEGRTSHRTPRRFEDPRPDQWRHPGEGRTSHRAPGRFEDPRPDQWRHPRGRENKSPNTPAIRRPPPRSMEPPPGKEEQVAGGLARPTGSLVSQALFLGTLVLDFPCFLFVGRFCLGVVGLVPLGFVYPGPLSGDPGS